MKRLTLLGTGLLLALVLGIAGPAVTMTPDGHGIALDPAPVVSAQPGDDDDDDGVPGRGTRAAATRAGGFNPAAVAGITSMLGLTTLGAGLVLRRRRRK